MPRVAATLLVYKSTQLNGGFHSRPGFDGNELPTHQNESPLGSPYSVGDVRTGHGQDNAYEYMADAYPEIRCRILLSLVSRPHRPLCPFPPPGTKKSLATWRCFQELPVTFASQPSGY
jgi:hypothetical protein